ETNASAFMQIWNLPESARLEAQTLDKLSTAPWRLLKGMTNGAASTNAQTPVGASTLLRPLLEDLIQEESFLEITGARTFLSAATHENSAAPNPSGAPGSSNAGARTFLSAAPHENSTAPNPSEAPGSSSAAADRNVRAPAAELALAIKLTEARAELWRTNLAAVLESLTSAKSVPSKDQHGFDLELTLHASRSTLHVAFT